MISVGPKVATLDEACDLVTDGTHYTPADVGSGVPFLTVKDMTAGSLDFAGCSFITDTDFQAAKSGNSAPVKGDVLFSKDGTVGKVHVVSTDQPFAVLSSIAILRPSRDVDAGYLAHALRSPSVVAEAVRNKTGSAIRRIVLADLKRLKIPLPPLAEQRRIADILDRADALRTKRRTASELLDHIAQSLFVDMFGDPLANPLKWPTRTLAAVSVFENGDRSANYPSGDDIKPGGILFLNTRNIANSQLDLARTQWISETKFSSLTRGKAKAGDLLICLRGTIGACCIVDSSVPEAFINAQLMIIRPKEDIAAHYMHGFLTSRPVQTELARVGSGVAVPQLTASQLSDFPIPTPPVELQRTYSDRLAALSPRRSLFDASLPRFDALFASLQHRAFRGEL